MCNIQSQSPGRGSRIEEAQACRLFIVTTVAPAPSDKKALEGVAKRVFLEPLGCIHLSGSEQAGSKFQGTQGGCLPSGR